MAINKTEEALRRTRAGFDYWDELVNEENGIPGPATTRTSAAMLCQEAYLHGRRDERAKNKELKTA